jgi:hypothetical protein
MAWWRNATPQERVSAVGWLVFVAWVAVGAIGGRP